MTAPGCPRTIPVYVVVPPRVLLLDVAGPLEVLRRANLEQSAVRFSVSYVAPDPSTESSIGLLLAALAPLPAELPKEAVVLVPGSASSSLHLGGQDEIQASAAEEAIVTWLTRSIQPGMRLLSICSGALLAARAGLLDGFECTTHHESAAALVKIAPLARVLENRLFVDSGERLTSAGVTAGIDLMLHVVSNEAGNGVALAVARHLVVYLRRTGADPQLSPWLEGRNHVHPIVHRAQDAILREPARRWPVATLARVAGTSVRNLSRVFGEQTGMSVSDYVNRLRIARAHELLTSSQLNMEDVAERSGFSSTRQFRRAWNRLHPMPPSRVRAERRSREADGPEATKALPVETR